MWWVEKHPGDWRPVFMIGREDEYRYWHSLPSAIQDAILAAPDLLADRRVASDLPTLTRRILLRQVARVTWTYTEECRFAALLT